MATGVNYGEKLILRTSRGVESGAHSRLPAVSAILNSAVLALMDILGVTNVRSQMHIFSAQPHLALQLLLTER